MKLRILNALDANVLYLPVLFFFKWRNGFKSNCILALILPIALLSLTYMYVFGSYPNVTHTCTVYLMNIF